jgi:threonine synthase
MTPLIRFQQVYLKREDQNLTGSAKDRAISVQVDNLIKTGFSSAVLSSTGNAAISADYFCHQHNIPLTIFVSPKVNPAKLLLITHAKVITTDTPISEAFKFSKVNNSYLLRQSTDPVALLGYNQIGSELITELPDITSLFIPVGSGSTLLGISQKLPENIKIFAVQPASYCPIAGIFDHQFTQENSTITDSITAKYLPLKNKLITVINQSGGGGIVVQDVNVQRALSMFTENDIITSPEGALAFAGYEKAKNLYDIGPVPVILLTGSKR